MRGNGAARALGLLACGALLVGAKPPPTAAAPSSGAADFVHLALDVCASSVGRPPQQLEARARPFTVRFFSAPDQAQPQFLRTARWALYLGDKEGLYVIAPSKAKKTPVIGYASENADRCAATAQGVPGADALLRRKLAGGRSGWARTALRTTRFGGAAELWTHAASDGRVDTLMQVGERRGQAFAIVTGPENFGRPSSSEMMRSFIRRLVAACTKARPGKPDFAWGTIADTKDGFSVTTGYPDPPAKVVVHRRDPNTCTLVATVDDPTLEAAVIQDTLAKLAVATNGANSYRLRSGAGGRTKAVTANFKRIDDFLTVTFGPA